MRCPHGVELSSSTPCGECEPRATAGSWNGLAIASLVLGLLWIWWLGSLLAIVLGVAARRQIGASSTRGRSLASVGILFGLAGFVALAVALANGWSFGAGPGVATGITGPSPTGVTGVSDVTGLSGPTGPSSLG